MTRLLIYINRTEHRARMYEDALGAHFPEVDLRLATTHQAAIEAAPWMDVLVTYGSQIDDALIAGAGRLKWIHLLATGTDFLWKVKNLGQDIVISNTRGIHGPPMSEMALMMMIGMGRGFPRFMENQRAGVWMRHPGTLIDGKTVGILGIGAIAEDLAPKCKAMGMTVIGISETERPVAGIDRFRRRADLARVVPELDYLVVLVPHTPETESIIDRQILAAMKPTAYLLNLARGGVVDEQALIRALEGGAIAGAGLDAFRTEPLPADSPLWAMKNVIVTPHNSGLYDEYVSRALPILEENLRCFLAGDPQAMTNLVKHHS